MSGEMGVATLDDLDFESTVEDTEPEFSPVIREKSAVDIYWEQLFVSELLEELPAIIATLCSAFRPVLQRRIIANFERSKHAQLAAFAQAKTRAIAEGMVDTSVICSPEPLDPNKALFLTLDALEPCLRSLGGFEAEGQFESAVSFEILRIAEKRNKQILSSNEALVAQ